MDVMMRRATQAHSRGLGSPRVEYLEQTAHSVEVRREMNEKGELGSYGFILVQERPPIVGNVVPGGPAEKAGLKKNEVVVAVNNNDIINCSHQEVVAIIANNPSPSIWLTVCEAADTSRSHLPSHGPSMGRVSSLGTLSVSTPMVNSNYAEPRRMYTNDDSPPRYFEITRNQPRTMNSYAYSSTTSSINVSPLTQVYRPNGLSNSDQGFPQRTISSPTPSPSAFTSANVLVLYIGAVEIPLSWRVRELSSRCLQECTRQLLSQRQEFLEVFLEVNLKLLRILKVDQVPLFSHPREELFYCGVCTNDEQYFGIVTKKEQKGSKKGSQSNGQFRAHMCHVFKVMQSKSVLVLKTGDSKVSPRGKSISTTVKPKTIPIVSCVTIINALQGLFTPEDLAGTKLFSDPSSLRGSSDQSLKLGQSLSSYSSGGSGGSSESVSSPEKAKKLDVVDLRPSAFTAKQRSLLTQSLPQANPNMYVTPPQHSRSHSKDDFPLTSMATPAFIHQRQSSGGGTWYSADSPKENRHSRENSWDNRESKSRPVSGSFEKYTVHVPQSQHTTSGSSGGRASGGSSKHSYNAHGFDQLSRKISDDSSMSSLSDSRDSPTKLQFVSRSRSHSPSPPQSLSYSSGSRSPSPTRRHRSPSPGPMPRAPAYRTPSVSKLSAGLALETSRHYRAMSPAGSYVSSRGLRRQGSENSIMDAPDTPYRTSLPQKNSALTSSIGSVATLTTVADEDVNDPEECGRVGGWVASFDKLLQDPMGVQCLLHFLEKEHCEENILFWRDAQAFKLNAPRTSNYQEVVKKIYDQYLSPTSPSTVNVDDRVLKGVESRLTNPPLNIFNEAQDQIYQLMKMDCYPRFKKSDIVRQCLMAEMEGKPLPIDPSPPQKTQESQQYNGIWKKHRERGFGRSLFSKLGRKVHQEPQPPVAIPIWGVVPEGKSPPDSGKKKKKDSQRRSTARDSLPKASDGKSKGSGDNTSSSDLRPQDHLDMFQAHKRNVFEVNLPNKVTKIMQVPERATVREAIKPVLKKYGYDFDIMELRFANTFSPVNLDLSADILIGQHILVARSKNTFIAAFPDQLDKILPADGSRSVGELFASVLNDMDKLQNFQVFCEGSRVPLELTVDTSVLVSQKVVVRYLPGPCPFPVPSKSTRRSSGKANNSKSSFSSSNGSKSNDMDGIDDLFSKIAQLQGDTLSDQRTSPTPHTTPEPESFSGNSRARSQDDLLDKHSPNDMRRRANSAGKHSPNANLSHKMLSVSKSIGVLGQSHVRHHSLAPGEPHYSQQDSSRNRFKRVQSGSSINSTQKAIHYPANRSISPPAGINYEEARHHSNVSPPPPTSKPPPLPKEAKRLSGGGSGKAQNSHRSSSTKSDSLSSEESSLMRNDRHRRHPTSEHIYENRPAEVPQFFPQAHPHQTDGPVYVNGAQERHRYTKNRPVNLSSLAKDKSSRPSMMPSPPRDDQHHPLDNVVNEAFTHQKKPGQSGQKRNIQTGTNLSSYPWHTAHSRKAGGQLTSSRRRRDLTENTDLIQRGNEIIRKDMDEFHSSHSDGGSSHSGSSRTPLSPTTHVLTLPEDPGCETFV